MRTGLSGRRAVQQHLQPERGLGPCRSAILTAKAFPDGFSRRWRDLWRPAGGSGLTGLATGAFFGNTPGNPASETRGNFAAVGTGPPYLASGIFRQTLTRSIFRSGGAHAAHLSSTSGDPPKIVAAPVQRAWMDRTDQGFAYRCLPLNIAKHGGRVEYRPFHRPWDAGAGLDAISLHRAAEGPLLAMSHSAMAC